jgi:hypothetical protein
MTKSQAKTHTCSFRMTGSGRMVCQHADCRKVEIAPSWLRRSL